LPILAAAELLLQTEMKNLSRSYQHMQWY